MYDHGLILFFNAASIHFSKIPKCNIKSLVSHDKNYPIKSFNELFLATQNIGNWRGLCRTLQVSDAIMDGLEFNTDPDIHKKEKCLKDYFRNRDPDWKEVVAAIANYPISNKHEACKIADKYMKDKEEIKSHKNEL